MKRMIVRRLAGIPLTLLIVSLLVFLLTAVVPGDVARRTLGREATQEAVDHRRHELGLDRPLVVQYGDWLFDAVRGDWGTSYTTEEPVRPLVLDRLGSSLLLAGFALVLVVPLSIGLGVAAGLRPGTRTDRAISVGALSLSSIPDFVVGVVVLVVFAVQLRWFPASARAPTGAGLADQLDALVLPASVLALNLVGYLCRLVRASTIDTGRSSFVRTAVLKGLPRRAVLGRHLLRNSLLPLVTALGIQSSALLGSFVTIELLFNYPGIGNLLLEAGTDKDLPTLQATAMVTGVIYILCILVTDVAYGLIDPRVRQAEAAA